MSRYISIDNMFHSLEWVYVVGALGNDLVLADIPNARVVACMHETLKCVVG
jgi:hypothetical protein